MALGRHRQVPSGKPRVIRPFLRGPERSPIRGSEKGPHGNTDKNQEHGIEKGLKHMGIRKAQGHRPEKRPKNMDPEKVLE